MKPLCYAIPLAIIMLIASLAPLKTAAAGDPASLDGDALHPPKHVRPLMISGDFGPSLYQPSAFMAGHVAVQALLPESDGSLEPSRENWSDAQVAATRAQITAALDWWRARLPNADLSFDLAVKVVPTSYEPIGHGLSTEGDWIGDALTRMGTASANYFDQAYLADDRLRRERHTDWATTIFVVNSAGVPGGRFADGRFAYAYVSGPFMVVTSDAGPYGAAQMAPVVAHELGHIFGALDQYASAGTPCSQLSGYLGVPTTNSQTNNCGTRFPSIMLDPLSAYAHGDIDESARAQLGYRDGDNDGLPDPIDTVPSFTPALSRPASGRPILTGSAVDQPYPSPLEDPATINTIQRIEYRVDGGAWSLLAPLDGAYDDSLESVSAALPLYDGRHTVEARTVNSRGAASPVTSATVDVGGVGAEPAYGVAVPALTRDDTITVTLSAPAGSSVQISEDPLFAGASWRPASPSLRWPVGASDGKHSLYVRFREPGGLESPPFVRSVLLDSTPPSGQVIRHLDTQPWLEILAQDSGSGVSDVQIAGGGADDGAWQPFQPRIPLGIGTSSEIQVRLRDEAGNVSLPLALSSNTPVYIPLLQR